MQDSPVISGPSFLGLNDPGPRRGGGLSDDPHGAHSSRNLDYLLQDEEEPSHGGGAKFVLILLALALAVGFGYLRWKNHGLPWLNSLSSGASKPAATQRSDGSDANSTAPQTSSVPSTTPSGPASTPPPNIAAAPATTAAQPAADSTTNTASPGASHPTTNPATGSAPANVTPATSDAAPAASSANSGVESATAPASAAKDKNKEKEKDDDRDAETGDPNSSPAASPKSNEAVATPASAPKPRAAIPRVAPTDNIAEAQKYIYGRGVAQDCERGMRLLKPAANQSNPKAMVEMGALYSAGLCTPHDLPTAYRWFALALRKDPDNQAVQADLQKLWGEMTQPERQLAIKLSQ